MRGYSFVSPIYARIMTEIIKINQTEILCPTDENGVQLIAVKPVCQALGVSHDAQTRRMKTDPILSPTATHRVVVGGDNKQREMVCIPLKYVFGWLFSIDTNKVKPEAREALIQYRQECYDVLYDHFHLKHQLLKDHKIAILEKRNRLLTKKEERKTINWEIKKIQNELDELVSMDIQDVKQIELFTEDDE